MTCTEAREIMCRGVAKGGGPFAVSRAERWGAARHYAGCRSCRRFVAKKVKEEDRRRGRRLTAREVAAIEAEVEIIKASDLADPEA